MARAAKLSGTWGGFCNFAAPVSRLLALWVIITERPTGDMFLGTPPVTFHRTRQLSAFLLLLMCLQERDLFLLLGNISLPADFVSRGFKNRTAMRSGICRCLRKKYKMKVNGTIACTLQNICLLRHKYLCVMVPGAGIRQSFRRKLFDIICVVTTNESQINSLSKNTNYTLDPQRSRLNLTVRVLPWKVLSRQQSILLLPSSQNDADDFCHFNPVSRFISYLSKIHLIILFCLRVGFSGVVLSWVPEQNFMCISHLFYEAYSAPAIQATRGTLTKGPPQINMYVH